MRDLSLADCIVPDWPAPPGVHAIVTTRAGGVSTGPYASLNLGFSSGDDEAAVAMNRARLATLLPDEARWLKQVHGSEVLDADRIVTWPQGDASVARLPDTVCAILIADCLPVLLTSSSGSVVGAAHAGWRGLASSVIEKTVQKMLAWSDQDELIAYIGPGIGRDAFEVGADVYDAFVTRDALDANAFVRTSPGKWKADLVALARSALARCGVTRVYGGELCTYSDRERFYSYRRDRMTGRMGAFIWRSAEAAER